MSVCWTPEGEMVRPILTADDCYHYSDMPTEEYRRRFGYWAFGVFNPGEADGPTVRAADGHRIPVPEGLGWEAGCPASFLLEFPSAIPVAFELGRRWFATTRGQYDSAVFDTELESSVQLAREVAPRADAPAPPPGSDNGGPPSGAERMWMYDDVPIGAMRDWVPAVSPPVTAYRPADGLPDAARYEPMTEAGWLAAEELGGLHRDAMLCFLGPGACARKLRLYAVRCWFEQWGGTDSPGWVEAGERFADGLMSGAELKSVLRSGPRAEDWGADALTVARRVSQEAYLDGHGRVEEQCAFLRDVFGNPHRPVTVDPTWRTSAVVWLARGIYDEQAFDRLPALADALEDAGCTNADVLSHCRGSEPHTRGCWLLDLLLGQG